MIDVVVNYALIIGFLLHWTQYYVAGVKLNLSWVRLGGVVIDLGLWQLFEQGFPQNFYLLHKIYIYLHNSLEKQMTTGTR